MIVSISEQIVLSEIAKEYQRADMKFEAFHSAHEGFAVLLEEVNELWDEIKLRKEARRPGAMRREAIQVAAMALRFILEVCMEEEA